jgi:hypothetical protein
MRLLLAFLLVLAGFRAEAQMVDGYVVTNTRDTLRGKLNPGTPAQRTVRIAFKADGADEAIRFEPFQIVGFAFDGTGEFYESKYFRLDPLDDDAYAVFMRRDNEGPVRVYQFWNVFVDRGYFQTFLQRGDQNIKEVDYTRFRQQMAEFFDDNAELSARIKAGEFKKKDLVKLVLEYNAWKLRGK